jgi:Ca2+/Na+ antiporter
MSWKLIFSVILSMIGFIMVIMAVVMWFSKQNHFGTWLLFIFGFLFLFFGLGWFVWEMAYSAEISIPDKERCNKSDIKPVDIDCCDVKCYIPDPITVKLPDLIIQPSPVKVEQPCYTSTTKICGDKTTKMVEASYTSSDGAIIPRPVGRPLYNEARPVINETRPSYTETRPIINQQAYNETRPLYETRPVINQQAYNETRPLYNETRPLYNERIPPKQDQPLRVANFDDVSSKQQKLTLNTGKLHPRPQKGQAVIPGNTPTIQAFKK